MRWFLVAYFVSVLIVARVSLGEAKVAIHSILAALPSRAAASCSILPARIVLPLLFVPSQVYPRHPRHAGDEVGIGAQLWVVPTTTSLIHACRGQMQLAYG